MSQPSSIQSFKPQRIQLVKRYEYTNNFSLWFDKLDFIIQKISLSSDKKKNNYDHKHIDLLGHLSFDILVWNEEIIAFSGVYSGGRYPAGAFRVLNRCYVAPEFRTKKIGEFSALNSQYLLSAQLAEFADEIEFPFVSREGALGYYFLKKWATEHSPGLSWQVSDNMIHLVPNSSEPSAYQHISYPKKTQHLEVFNKISPVTWRALDAK